MSASSRAYTDQRIQEQIEEENYNPYPSHLELDYGKTKKDTSGVKGSKKSA